MQRVSPGVVSKARSPFESNYQKTVLPNGIRIVTEDIPYVRSVSFGTWVDIGSRDEHEDNNGIAHFIEHMVFKGTKNYSLKRIARSLESVGGYLNAFTSKEHTCFYARALDVDLATAIGVIGDLLRHPLFEKKELEKEKDVVLEELKNIEDDPDDLINDYFDQSIYQNHPLRFPVIGRAENIRSFTRNQLFDYLERHYVPDRLVIAAAGNVNHEQVVELVARQFPRRRPTPSSLKRVSGPKSHRPVSRVYEKPITQAHICLGTIGYGVRSRHRYPLLVLNTLLGEGMSSRLFQQLRERHALAYTVFSFMNTMSDTGNFGVYAGTDVKHIDRSIHLIHRELEKLKSLPVGNAELQRTKSQLKGTMMLSLESMSSRMMRLGSGEMYYGDNISVEEVVRKIDAVTARDITEVAHDLLRMENFSTVVLRPLKGGGPAHGTPVVSVN